jgi:Asp-tRNA(Asn)/Glu-tRNA(Gln) amidotransferase A subunit family amidase
MCSVMTAKCDLDSALDALARTEGTVHAYRHVLQTDARHSAATPIAGWPFAVKEVFDVAGVATSGGSRAYANRVPARDATAVARLRAAGGALVGTQVCHELTCGLDQPPTRNPWNPACYPGGSSAGAGISVAVGSARIALGTDAAGSVRIPAAMTGTTGLKPTRGLVSAHGVMREASAPSIDHVGIIARSAYDIARVLPVLAGADPLDAATLQARPAHETEAKARPRLAVLGVATLDALASIHPLDPEIETAFSDALDVFRAEGAEIVEIELARLPMATEAVVTLFSAELAAANAERLAERRGLFAPGVADMIDAGLAVSDAQLAEAVQVRSRLRRDLSAGLAAAGAGHLLTPTTPRPAMPLAGFDPGEDLATLIPFTCGFNLTGNPAISVPCGLTGDGLPVGLQIVGRHFREDALLALAARFQTRTDWHERRPPL